jgi:crotonobetainyl-CoA:carnitine CoA-transferase CaiB-like acyl-CoA transferase
MKIPPLHGIRVLDLTHYQAGPTCTLLLAELGAEVIKVEPPWGEQGRFAPPLVNGLSPYFAHLNKDKKSITLNLKKDKGRKIFFELVKKSDVVVENYAPGTMKRLGIDYDTLKKVNPKIILASISGFGQYGPYSRRLSFDPIAQAMSGFMMLNGDVGDEKSTPLPLPEAPGDTIPGMFGTIGVLAALHHKEISGKGQHVDVAQLDSLVSVNISMTYFLMTGYTWRQTGRLTSGRRSWGLHEAKDGTVFIAAARGTITDRFCELLGVEELDWDIIETWTKKRTTNEIVEILVKAKIPVAPVFTVDEALKNPQLAARNMIVKLKHPQAESYETPSFPIKFSETPASVCSGSPLLGEQTEEILTSILEISEKEIQSLREESIL